MDNDFFPSSDTTESGWITQAIAAVTADLFNCVTFTPTLSTAQVYKIKFTPLTGAA